ncbi:MAG: sugar-transfer associated ATP-grasp domain-containing protein, partial [Ancrocorticia sp.]|uniref:sugar-transfer associated ATP-grasp domain-containing protein n=1 Tax=Ancrocorticia sp. TaxID=2593684 RepID=UPI003F908F41
VISRHDFYLLDPLNGRERWLSSRLGAHRTWSSQLLPPLYCSIASRDGALEVTRLSHVLDGLSRSMDGVLALIESRRIVRLWPDSWDRGPGYWLTHDGRTYGIDGQPANAKEIVAFIDELAHKAGRLVLSQGDDPAAQMGSQLGYSDAVVRFYLAKDESKARVVDAFLLAGDSLRRSDSAILAHDDHWAGTRFAAELQVDLATSEIMGRTPQEETNPKLLGLDHAVAGIETALSDEDLRFRFISVDVALTSDGYRVEDVARAPRYPRTVPFSAQATEFLLPLRQEKRAELAERPSSAARAAAKVGNKAGRFGRRLTAFQLRSTGFTGRMARSWVRQLEQDWHKDDEFSGAFRRDAHRMGYMPTTLARFNISKLNAHEYISEKDYRYVQPLNGKYAKWVRDRASVREIFKPYSEFFESAHYQFLWRDGELQILPLSEDSREYPATADGIGAFLASTGRELAAVSSAYTGRTRLAISFTDSHFVVDNRRYTSDEFQELMRARARRRPMVIIEPVAPDETLSQQFPEATSDLRIVMMNADGASPQVAEAFVAVTQHVNINDVAAAASHAGPAVELATNPSLLEAEIALQQEADDDDALSGPTSQDWREIAADIAEEGVAAQDSRVTFLSRIDTQSGEYRGARAVIDQRLYSFDVDPLSGNAFAGKVRQWEAITQQLTAMCRFAPQLEFVEFTLVPQGDSFAITRVSAMPDYGYVFPFQPHTVEFLQDRVGRKKAEMSDAAKRVGKWLHNAKLRIRRSFGQALYPKGLVPYQSVRWIGDVMRDVREPNGIPLRKKLWAYRNGLLSYRITQYGITKENREEFISDLEYRWLRHINKKYKYWLEDKISIKYVASQFNECFPAYYYFTSLHDGENKVIPMMDCPEGFGASFDEILRLARERGVLALKPDEGSHGDGFYRLDFDDDGYSLNGEAATQADVVAILADPSNQYLITEFIQTHPDLAQIYPKAVNTIRMIVFKRDGVTPQIGTAYFRIGTEASGFVDNTAQGGMLAQIDIDTGEFGNAQVLRDGYVQPCPVHPDSGVLIEGVIPDWQSVKSTVLQIAESMQQLEFLGFDLAITPDGIKLPEINRSPDYPRIQKLTPETIEYLLYKVEQKKRATGYYHRRRAIIDLPPRGGA